MSAPRIFISYSHDSDGHREQVLALSERLRADGLHAEIDQYVNGAPPQGWPRWMLDQLDAAEYVLVVCTETYYRRFRGHEVPGKGKGVDWEGALITQELYDCRCRTLKFVPIFLSDASTSYIPEPLRSVNFYHLNSEENYQNLYNFLLKQAGVEPRPIGSLKPKPRQTGIPLTFGPPPAIQSIPADLSRILKYAPEHLIGRETETQRLNDAWLKVRRAEPHRPHVLTFVALGGEGKTSLVAKWAATLADDNWPGCDAAFAWSFYSQGTRDQQAASSDLFLKEALTFFGDDDDQAFAASPAGAFEKGQRLARIIGQRRSILILDGLEPLQYAPTSPTPGELKDQGITALLKALATTSHGLCVITTRYPLPDLKAFRQTTAPEIPLLRLSKEAGIHLLQQLGVRKESGSKTEFEKLVEDVKGHALTLTLLGSFMHDAYQGDIRKRDLVKLEEANAEEQGGHAFHVMAAYERELANEGDKGQRALAVLRLLGLFDRPITEDCFTSLLKTPVIVGLTGPLFAEEKKWFGKKPDPHPIPEAQLSLVLNRLESAKLLTVNRTPTGALISLDAHPLLREYFATRLRANHLEAWRAGHQRLYDHLCATTKEGDRPTLEDFQPLYQAVAHGCQGELCEITYSDVYRRRIVKSTDGVNSYYSTLKLGAFGSDLAAIRCFFESSWNDPGKGLEEESQAWLLNQAALRLRALGRITEARESLEIAMRLLKSWPQSVFFSAVAVNLNAVELLLGNIQAAVICAQEGLQCSEQIKELFSQLSCRTSLGFALHQLGMSSDAQRIYSGSLLLEEGASDYTKLYSSRGFRWFDFALANAEKYAWRIWCGFNVSMISATIQSLYNLEKTVQEAQSYAGKEKLLMELGLNSLCLAKISYYRESMESSGGGFSNAQLAIGYANDAVRWLSIAGRRDYLPISLLFRSWLRFLTGARTGPDSAQADLDEAWEIAERGPMRLFQADIRLHRARLFFREPEYPWESPAADLAAAETLINTCGYHRRDEELADAKRAILG